VRTCVIEFFKAMSNLKMFKVDPDTGRFSLGLSKPSVEISGIDLLVQNVAQTYLTNGGRSIVYPDRLGGLRQYLGANVDLEDSAELNADIVMMTRQIEQQIKEEQNGTRRPPSERLQELRFIDIIPDEQESAIEIRVQVVNEEQQQAQALVAV
jgi:hypothetical protein